MDPRITAACAKELNEKELLTEELRRKLLAAAIDTRKVSRHGFATKAAKRFKREVDVPYPVVAMENACWALVKRYDRIPSGNLPVEGQLPRAVPVAAGDSVATSSPSPSASAAASPTASPAAASPSSAAASQSPASTSTAAEMWTCPGCKSIMNVKGSGRHLK